MTIFHLPPFSNSDISVMEVIFVDERENMYMYSVVHCCLLSQM